MKHHCEGFKGWFETCPQDAQPIRGLFLTDDQNFMFTNAAIVIGGLLVLMLIIVVMQYLVSLTND